MILAIGDTHLGNARADLPALIDLLLRARSPVISEVVLTGDVIDNYGLYATQAFEQPPEPLTTQSLLFGWLVGALKEVGRDPGIYIAIGNHDKTPVGNAIAALCRLHNVICADHVLLAGGEVLVIHAVHKRSAATFNNTPLNTMALLEALALDPEFKRVKVIVSGHTHNRLTLAQVANKYHITLPALIEPRGYYGIRPKVAVALSIYSSNIAVEVSESPGYPLEHRQACIHKLLAELIQGRTPGLEESARICGVR